MNLGATWVNLLRERGHDAVHWKDIGEQSASDEDIMATAKQRGAAILSGDLDFGKLHAFSGSKKPSVIQIRDDDTRTSNVGILVVRALTVAAHELQSGAIVTIKAKRVRVARLPIGNLDLN